jgi:hypothetical protein
MGLAGLVIKHKELELDTLGALLDPLETLRPYKKLLFLGRWDKHNPECPLPWLARP